MKLTLQESDLKPEYQEDRAAQEKASFDMFTEKAQKAIHLVNPTTFVSNDGKIQVSVYPPRSA